MNFPVSLAERYLHASVISESGWMLQLNLLGPCQVFLNGEPVTARMWPRNDSLVLFKLLLLRRDESISRVSAIETLWPDIDLISGRRRLSNALCGLKKGLALYLDKRHVKAIVISNTNAIICKKHPNLITDVDLFEDDLDLAAMSSRPAERMNLINRAVACYTGHLLEDAEPQPWFASERELLRYRFIGALRTATELARTLDNGPLRLANLEKLFQEQPEDETTAVEIATLCAKEGCFEKMRSVFDALRRSMASTSGTRPSEAAFEAFEKLQAQAPASSPSLATANPTRSLTTFDKSFTNLVGRSNIVQRIVDTVLVIQPRLLIISGPRGIGKNTALHHALWRLTIHYGFSIDARNVGKDDTPSGSLHTNLDAVQIWLYPEVREGDVIGQMKTKFGVVGIVTTTEKVQSCHDAGVVCIELSELDLSCRKELFFERTAGLACADMGIQTLSGGQPASLLDQCLEIIGGFPQPICHLAEQYLAKGPQCLIEVIRLTEFSNWSVLGIAQQAYREGEAVFASLEQDVQNVVSFLGTSHFQLSDFMLASILKLSHQATRRALECARSQSLVRLVNLPELGEICSATFEGHIIAHLDRLKTSQDGVFTIQEMLIFQAHIQSLWMESGLDKQKLIVQVLHLNAPPLIRRLKMAMSSPDEAHLQWIRSLKLWLDQLDQPEKQGANHLISAVNAAYVFSAVDIDHAAAEDRWFRQDRAPYKQDKTGRPSTSLPTSGWGLRILIN